ncbi:MAG: cytochrome d ubiquinol oxidase subunit II [Gemmatimonadaceae bacterium]
MSDILSTAGKPEVVAGIIVLALNAYVLMGGADYGGGVWDLFASGPRRDAQRELIANTIAPIWEANHVWLIVVVVMLFTGFPAAFATVGIVMHVPLTLMLLGIVLRGSSFVFRSYGSQTGPSRRWWGTTFAIASVITPVLLGDVIGAITSGAVGFASNRISTASFASVYIEPWLAAFPLSVGAFALALFAFLAAVYLAHAAHDAELQEDFRKRALVMASAVLVTATVAMLLSSSAAPRVMEGVMFSGWGILIHVATGTSAVTAIVMLWKRNYAIARYAAAAQVSCIVWGWAFSQYPYVIPTTLTIHDSAAPEITLDLLLTGLGVGALVLIPSLWYLFRTFTARRRLTR